MIFHSIKYSVKVLPTSIMKTIEIGLFMDFMTLTKSLLNHVHYFPYVFRTQVPYVCSLSSTRPSALRVLRVSYFYVSSCFMCYTSPRTVFTLLALNSLKYKFKSTLILLIFITFPTIEYIAR